MKNIDFIKQIAPIIQKEAFKRGYKYPSAIIAQAVLESAYGTSQLAYKYHNYFGLKCGGSWRGRSVNMNTKEEYTVGTLTNIRANFRAYDSMEDGVKGYFDFIGYSRYANLKKAKSSADYLQKIKADGYATSNNYVANVYRVVTTYNLTQYDKEPAKDEPVKVEKPDDDPKLESAIDVIADYVINGYFGNGKETRKENIYRAVQGRVNEKVRK